MSHPNGTHRQHVTDKSKHSIDCLLQVVEAKTKQPANAAAAPAAAAAAAADPSGFKTPAAPKAVARAAGAGAAGDDAGHAAAGSDSPSLTIKLLDPVSTGGKAAAHGHGHAAAGLASVGGLMGPPAAVGGKTPAAFKTPALPVSEQVR
jgi:hypothetical protein